MKPFHRAMLCCALLSITAIFSSCENSPTPSQDQKTIAVNAPSQKMMESDQPDENGTCTDCKGSGTFQGCNVCRNQGSQKCNRCSGSGDDGRGTPGCETCLSEGKISCSSCQSAGANYVGKCIRCNGGGKTTFKECDNCESGKSSPKIQILGLCVLCEGKGRVEIPAS